MASFRLGPLATSRGYRLHGYDSVGSTSSAALAAADAGDVGEVWFCALEQTAGRGRRGRPWQTIHGNLAASLVLRPTAPQHRAAGLGFVAGVALHQALAETAPQLALKVGMDGAAGQGSRVALKWPNDVLADGAKLAGILLEAHARPEGYAVVIGIGVNVVAAPDDLPYPATSLAALGVPVAAETLFTALADAFVHCYELWNNGEGLDAVLALWRASAAGLGAEVAVARDGEVVRGIFETIDRDGRLIVRSGDGQRVAISAGDVHFGATASIRN